VISSIVTPPELHTSATAFWNFLIALARISLSLKN
jgi:hypothetical protein